MSQEIKPCPFCGCEAHDDGGASCMSTYCPLSALNGRIPSINEWNNAWAHREIARLTEQNRVYRECLEKISVMETIYGTYRPTPSEFIAAGEKVREFAKEALKAAGEVK